MSYWGYLFFVFFFNAFCPPWWDRWSSRFCQFHLRRCRELLVWNTMLRYNRLWLDRTASTLLSLFHSTKQLCIPSSIYFWNTRSIVQNNCVIHHPHTFGTIFCQNIFPLQNHFGKNRSRNSFWQILLLTCLLNKGREGDSIGLEFGLV